MTSFADSLPDVEKTRINEIRDTIQSCDPTVTESTGKIMSATNALCYKIDDVMKYGLTKTASGFTFHSMVMYANPDIADFVKTNLPGVKLQKGCFNFPSLDILEHSAFKQMMTLSAAKNFQPIVDHYKKKSARK